VRTPSRLMPKYKRQPFGIAGGVVLLGLVCIGLYVLWVYPLLSPFALVVVAGLFAYERIKARRYFKRLISQRVGESLCTFSREQDLNGVDTFIVRAVYEEIQFDLPIENFPLRWSDQLYSDLRLEADDVEDLIERVAQKTARCLKHTASNPLFGNILTVGDLIAFFHHQPNN
jgi:hypothetical protein